MACFDRELSLTLDVNEDSIIGFLQKFAGLSLKLERSHVPPTERTTIGAQLINEDDAKAVLSILESRLEVPAGHIMSASTS